MAPRRNARQRLVATQSAGLRYSPRWRRDDAVAIPKLTRAQRATVAALAVAVPIGVVLTIVIARSRADPPLPREPTQHGLAERFQPILHVE